MDGFPFRFNIEVTVYQPALCKDCKGSLATSKGV